MNHQNCINHSSESFVGCTGKQGFSDRLWNNQTRANGSQISIQNLVGNLERHFHFQLDGQAVVESKVDCASELMLVVKNTKCFGRSKIGCTQLRIVCEPPKYQSEDSRRFQNILKSLHTSIKFIQNQTFDFRGLQCIPFSNMSLTPGNTIQTHRIQFCRFTITSLGKKLTQARFATSWCALRRNYQR